MRKTMIIPTYWCRRTGELWREGDAVYDHPTPVDQEGTLERTLLSMKQFHEKDFKLVILICPTTPEVEEEALRAGAPHRTQGAAERGNLSFHGRRPAGNNRHSAHNRAD